MTREEKIVAIYKEMANKELTFGCKVKFSKWIYSIIDRENVWFLDSYKGVDWNIRNTIVIEDGVNSRCYSIEEIIGHPVMIWDVIKRIKENIEISYWEYLVKLLGQLSRLWLWRWLGLSIDDQTDECIDYVYSLIKKS